MSLQENTDDFLYPGGQRTPLELRCLQCKTSRVRCEKLYPCQRCVRLGLSCSRQARKPLGRPPKKGQQQQQQQSQEASDGLTEVASTVGSGSGDEDLVPPPNIGVMTSSSSFTSDVDSFRSAADAICGALTAMQEEGKLDEARLLSSSRMWSLFNDRHEGDATLGMIDKAQSLLGPRKVSLAYGADPNMDTHLGQEQEGIRFGQGFLPRYVQELCNSVTAMTTGFVLFNGQLHTFCNSRFSETFMTLEEMDHKIDEYGVAPMLLWASILCPDEAPVVFSHLAEYMFAPPVLHKEMSRICKCLDKGGQRFLALLRARYVDILTGAGAAAGVALFPLPDSPYVSLPTGCQVKGVTNALTNAPPLRQTSPPQQPPQQQQGATGRSPTRSLRHLTLQPTSTSDDRGGGMKRVVASSWPSRGPIITTSSMKEGGGGEPELSTNAWIANLFVPRDDFGGGAESPTDFPPHLFSPMSPEPPSKYSRPSSSSPPPVPPQRHDPRPPAFSFGIDMISSPGAAFSNQAQSHPPQPLQQSHDASSWNPHMAASSSATSSAAWFGSTMLPLPPQPLLEGGGRSEDLPQQGVYIKQELPRRPPPPSPPQQPPPPPPPPAKPWR